MRTETKKIIRKIEITAFFVVVAIFTIKFMFYWTIKIYQWLLNNVRSVIQNSMLLR